VVTTYQVGQEAVLPRASPFHKLRKLRMRVLELTIQLGRAIRGWSSSRVFEFFEGVELAIGVGWRLLQRSGA